MMATWHASHWREIAEQAMQKGADLRKNAERYLWLRHGDNDERCIRLTNDGAPYLLRGALLDRCIDEAMDADAAQKAHTVELPDVGAA